MRAGGFALPHALAPEAAAVVKQAVVLAKRRGHAQVTPLHVANSMLSASNGLFRAACQEAHAHPLQCKALELCFNVALNRLPASSSSPILGGHSHQPSISNALVATFKRAQAHQRRGSIENQQQPILAVKIELEQLIISILDDPSVSRVMKEAGFSSTQVKNNVEKAISFSLDLSKDKSEEQENTPLTQNERKLEQIRNEDVNLILEALSRKRKSLAVVGESISNLENTVKGLMNRVEKGEVQEDLKELKFINMRPLYSFCNLKREDVEQEIGELTCLVKSLVGKGVVLYLGDFKWISDYRVQEKAGYYCAVEHVIMELGRLVWGIGQVGRFWLMGIATFETYMRCRNGYYNSLETLWGLHPVTIPANGLGLSLVSDQRDEAIEGGQGIVRPENNEIIELCSDCSAKFEDEAGNMQASKEVALSNLPPWLRGESRRLRNNDQSSEGIRELFNKWNSFCTLAHKQPQFQETLTLRSLEPNQNRTSSPITIHENADWRCTFSSNPNSSMNSASSSDVIEIEATQKFKEFNAENLNILCNALEKKVPWQKVIIPDIAGTVLQSRSGMLRRRSKIKASNSDIKQDTWLLFLGPDAQAKEMIARELAKVVFGSCSKFIPVRFSSFVSSDDCHGHKRGRDEESCMSYMEKLAQAVASDPHRVFFVEDLEEAEHWSQMGIKRAIERGRIRNGSGEEVSFCDAIIVLSCEGYSIRSRVCSPMKKMENGAGGETRGGVSLDLNLSFDAENGEDETVDDLGIFECVDRRVVFKNQDQ